MASSAFECACSELERATTLDRWAARGTLQLALMDAGLEAGSVSAAQLRVVVDRLVPKQLQSHGIGDVDAVCTRLRDALAQAHDGDAKESPDAVFARLGGATT